MSIGRDEMFAPLLAVYPKFEGAYREFLREWEGHLDRPYYLAIIDLVLSLVEDIANGETSHLPLVFQVVERWLLEGDRYVSEAAVVGLLEGLQNGNHHKSGTSPSDFEPFLGDEASYWWSRVEEFWWEGRLIGDDRTRH